MFDDDGARASLIASLTETPTEALLAALPPEVDLLEVRADLVGEIDGRWLRERCGKQLLYTLRSEAEGGAGPERAGDRLPRLAGALANGYDRVDLEAERDLSPALLAAVEGRRRVLSWHGGAATVDQLEDVFRRMASERAGLYKLVPAAVEPLDALAALQFLAAAARPDLVAFASGAAGFWSRLLAPRLGSPVVYGSAGARPAAPGQPTIAALLRDYGLPELPEVGALFGVAGNPVLHSLSPRLHNAGYRALELPFLYLPFEVASFGDLWIQLVEGEGLEDLGLALEGLSVTAPFKDAALTVAAEASPLAAHIGAANTLVRHEQGWFADSTDPAGVALPLVRRGVVLEGTRALVVGAGGAGRAVAAGLAQAGLHVTLANRDRERGLAAARELRLPFVALAELDPRGFRVVVNATPLGRGAEDPLAFDLERLDRDAIVVDLVYGEGATALVRSARERGLGAVEGREVLLYQAMGQFEQMTASVYPPRLVKSWLAEIGAESAGDAGWGT